MKLRNPITRRNCLYYGIVGSFVVASIFDAKPAHAASLENIVKKALQKAIAKMAEYYASRFVHMVEGTIKDWSKSVKSNGVKNADKTAVAVGAMSDSISKSIQDAELHRQKLESMPAVLARPFTGGLFSAEMMAERGIMEQLAEDSTSFLSELSKMKVEDIKPNITAFHEVLRQRAALGAIERDMDLASLLTDDGYKGKEEADFAKYHIYFQLVELYGLVPLASDEDRLSLLSKIGVVYEALHLSQMTRIRSKKLYEECIRALPDFTGEQQILSKDMGGEDYGISLHDLRRFEVERRWLNPNWHDAIDTQTGFTGLLEELAEQGAYESRIELLLMTAQERLNLIEGVITLNEIESGRADSLRHEATA